MGKWSVHITVSNESDLTDGVGSISYHMPTIAEMGSRKGFRLADHTLLTRKFGTRTMARIVFQTTNSINRSHNYEYSRTGPDDHPLLNQEAIMRLSNRAAYFQHRYLFMFVSCASLCSHASA